MGRAAQAKDLYAITELASVTTSEGKRMIYVTGDTHGRHDVAKLHARQWPEGQELSRDDYLVILGDFGAIWDWGAGDHELLAWYESQPWTTLFADGNHENFDLIDAFEVSEMFGGRVQVVPGYPHVIHLMRGEVYELPVARGAAARGGEACGAAVRGEADRGETVRCFVMGGAPSIDRIWRVEGRSWWPREEPDESEYDNATRNLEAAGWSVDYVFTHEVPRSAIVDALDWSYRREGRDPVASELSGYLQWVDERLDASRLRAWYAGHYHRDATVLDDRHAVLYQDILPLGEMPE